MEIMNTRLRNLPTYSLNNLSGISKRCDWLINGHQLLNITNTNLPKYIFVVAYRGTIGIKNLVLNHLSKIKSRFVLIVGSDDYTFPSGQGDKRHNMYEEVQDLIKILFESPYLVHIFAENLDTNNERLSAIPLGLVYSHYNIDFSPERYFDFDKKKTVCLSVHRIRKGPQYDDRRNVQELCKGPWRNFVKTYTYEISHSKFINELRDSKFCICIHGGGYDPCPRFFEAILNGSIPIIQHSPLDEVFAKFPVVFIDDLNEGALSEEFLLKQLEILCPFYTTEKYKDVLKLLTIDYWWKIIQGKFSPIKCMNCIFTVHSDVKNNTGKFCCKSCKDGKGHGKLCEQIKIE